MSAEITPYSVLVVEDEPGIANLLSDRLERLGLAVKTAASAEEAERQLRERAFSLMLLDYSLPGKNGLQFIESLRAEPGDVPPFIVTTGRGDERVAVALMKLGAWDYLVKDATFLEKVGPAAVKAITDSRMRAELEQKNSIIRGLMDSSPDPMLSLDRDLRYTSFNPAHAEVMKALYGAVIRIGDGALGAMTGPDREATGEILRRALAGETVTQESHFGPEGAPPRWFETKYCPLRGRSGAVTGVSVTAKDITQRRAVQEQLREKSEFFRSILESSGGSFVSIDRDGRYITFNAAHAEEMMAWFDAAIEPGKPVLDYIKDPTAAGRMKGHIDRGLRGEEYTEEMLAVNPATGVEHWFEVTVSPLKGPDGAVFGVALGRKDVTERRQAENALRESEERFRHVFENSNVAKSLTGMDGTLVPNRALCELLGYTAEELSRLKWQDITPPEEIGPVSERISRLLEGGESKARFVKRYLRKDGAVIWGDVSVALQRDESGKPTNFITSILDITASRKAEQENLLLTETIKASLNEIYIFDGKTLKFKFLNKGALANTGYTPEEAAALTPLDLKPDFTPETFEALAAPLRRGEKGVQIFETRHLRKDGTFYPVEVHLQYEAGQGVFLAVINDITERRKAERMMAEMADMQRVESLGALAGGIAHDFNNMLTGIMANLSLLNARVTGEEDREIIGESLEAARSARTLTNNLLAFSKGGKPVKKELCLRKMLADIFNLATRGAKAGRELKIAEDLWSVEGDETQLKQAINNLLVNSLQAMPDGGRLTLKAENTDGRAAGLPPGRYVSVTVSDTGVGIPKQYLRRIFEPYFTTKTHGHGLGLSMTWSVVSNHDGRVTAASEPGKGTSINVLLPATGRSPGEEAQKAAAVVKGSGRVLVLDDEEIVRKAVRRMLKELGYDCEATEDGSETLRRYREEAQAGRPFDAVILDLTIPGGLGGKDTGEALRREYPGAVIIVSSGYSEEPVMADFKAHGFNAVLPKPYRYEDLAQTLARLAGKK